MKMHVVVSTIVLGIAPLGAVVAEPATAPPGSPGASTTIDGRYLPSPPPAFRDLGEN
jgi:hypothetical protein